MTEREVCSDLRSLLGGRNFSWVVTGAAGFIGSHLVETLLALGQRVTGVDNFSTGLRDNIALIQARVEAAAWNNFKLVEGDVADLGLMRDIIGRADFVLHQAALGSVPRSMADPYASNQANVNATLAIFIAAHEKRVRKVVYASSSSVYGDAEASPKIEDQIGRPLSPYALTKRVCEEYADLFSRVYGSVLIGLRYFNVFGPRQSPEGAYAAVVPRWINAELSEHPCVIYGDGSTSRDFCYIDNVVSANIRAALSAAGTGVFNIACGESTNLTNLQHLIAAAVREIFPERKPIAPSYEAERKGDIRHSLADISKARAAFGYAPLLAVDEGIRRTVRSFVTSVKN